jgi:outer membrane autotransporter protein
LLGQLTGGGASADSNALGGRLGVFVHGNVGNGNRDTTQREVGFDFNLYNVTAGVDYRFTDQLILGAAFGYGNTNADFDQSPNKTTVDGWSGMLYGTYMPTDALYVDGILSGGHNNYDVRRLDPFSGLTATGNTDGTSFGASLGAGYDLNRQQWTFGPYARVSYVKVKVDGYQESPVAGNAYRFQSQDATSTTLALGGRASYAISTRYGVVLPQAWLDWTHEFSNDSQIITAQLVNDPTNTPINLLTDNPDRNFFHAGIGVSMQFAHGRSAYLLYERLFGHTYLGEGTLQAGVRLEF